MISKLDIQESAREWGVSITVVEKDYVLGWVLAGIAHHPIASRWIFKGGTCLKKAYFETYRFSEDLDFTIPKGDPFDDAPFTVVLSDIAEWVHQQSGISIPKDSIKVETYTNPRGSASIEASIYYTGPLAAKGSLPRIKFDLAQDEVVLMPPVKRAIFHNYEDDPPDGSHVLCYTLEELFAEKMRAFTDRLLPRDLYDIVNIYRHVVPQFDPTKVKSLFEGKCRFKNISYPTMSAFESHSRYVELPNRWDQMLRHQLPQLPPMDDFWSTLPELLEWLGGSQPQSLPRIGVQGRIEIEAGWQAPLSLTRWKVHAPIEIVRFAGANHLCVEMTYRKENNKIEHYVLEPYSLRRTKAGHILLCTRKMPTGEPRSFRIDRIISVKAVSQTFKPVFQVEFTMLQPASAPSLARSRSPRRHGRRGYL